MFKESETVELKKSLIQLKEGVISLSSMLNKRNHGKVYFGINDEGHVVGVSIGNKTKSDIVHEIHSNLKPLPVNINIEESSEDGKDFIEVSVEGDDTPYSAYGRYYIRLNDADILMQPGELQHFFENKEDTYSSWELRQTPYGVDDVDEDLLIDCIRNANDKGRLNYVYRNAAEALTKLGLLDESGNLNNAGWFLFGRNKPLLIKEATYPTDSRSGFGEIKEFRGNIFECINEVISYIQNRITYKARIVGIQREETPEIPLVAIREMVVNSFAHCAYARGGDWNTYTIYKSSVRIYNPGPIFRNIDPVRFASGSVGSKIRNILICQVLFDDGLIDAFGTGFDRTFTQCNKEGVGYSYQNDEFGFTFVFTRKPDFLSDTPVVDYNEKTLWLDSLDEALLKAIEENKYATIPLLSGSVHKSEPTVHRHLSHLVEMGLLKRVGSRKTGWWQVL